MSKILLVDDDIELTDLLAEVLRLTGFEVEVANNGQEALDKLNASHQLVLLDVMMPVLNGIETAQENSPNIEYSSNDAHRSGRRN